MIPVAWRFECANRACPARRPSILGGPITLDADGNKAQAIRQARQSGWRPCHEVLGSARRSLKMWYCPQCSLNLKRS